ncbi:MAG TPA: amino acid permease, partial [Ktedonobacteraceae bacterium]|nr:amino acid permease [Ktedonobacteraceae bacterium]
LIVMCVITAVGSFFDLSTVISMLIAALVLIQGIVQVVALTVLRRRQPNLRRPYRMWLYPLPSIIALVGWAYVYYSSGPVPILFSIAWVAVGVVAYLLWARFVEHTWPFGPKEIKEEYLEKPVEAEASA